MNENANSFPEERLKEIARQFRYPSTPDVTEAVITRLDRGSRPRVRIRSAWAIASFIVLILAVLFAVPGVRAEIVRFFQVGVVRIFPAAATPTAEPSLPQAPGIATPAVSLPVTATPLSGTTQYEPIHEVTIAGLAGETTLEAAQARVPFPIRLPAYPADLGEPDRVFLQEDGPMVILAWTDPADPQKARLSLHQIGPGSVMLGKFEPLVVQETQVKGEYAVWAQGPYLIQLTNRDYNYRRTVEGNTLIWEDNGITYRLETNLPLEEAIKIAESLE
jgi:hypothetical protein